MKKRALNCDQKTRFLDPTPILSQFKMCSIASHETPSELVKAKWEFICYPDWEVQRVTLISDMTVSR